MAGVPAKLARRRLNSETICLTLAPDKSTQVLLCRLVIRPDTEEKIMKNPLDSLWGTIISGLVLTVILYVFAANFLMR